MADNTWTRIVLREPDHVPLRYFNFAEKYGPVDDPLNAAYVTTQDARLLYLLESAQREYPTHAWQAVRLVVDVLEFDDRAWEVVLDTARREARRAALARIPLGDRKLLGLEEAT